MPDESYMPDESSIFLYGLGSQGEVMELKI